MRLKGLEYKESSAESDGEGVEGVLIFTAFYSHVETKDRYGLCGEKEEDSCIIYRR